MDVPLGGYATAPLETALPINTSNSCSFSFWWNADTLPSPASCLMSKRIFDPGYNPGLYFSYDGPSSCYKVHPKVNHWVKFREPFRPFARITPLYQRADSLIVRFCVSKSTWMIPNRLL